MTRESIPQSTAGTGSATVTFAPPVRMVLVENLDTTITITVKINGDPIGWQLLASSRKGNFIKGGVSTLALVAASGSPAWQVEGTHPCL
jgi:hypothetical protein